MSSPLAGRKTVTTAGTRVQLSSSVSALVVAIQPLAANTGKIAVGDNTVVAAAGSERGYLLAATSPGITLDVDDIGDVWIDSTVNGEGVSYLAVVA